jgi:hypothetical protein
MPENLAQIRVALAQTLFLLLSRFFLFWALGRARYVQNHKNTSLSINEGYTGFRSDAGRSQSYKLEKLYWQHACLRYEYWRHLRSFRQRSRNRPPWVALGP